MHRLLQRKRCAQAGHSTTPARRAWSVSTAAVTVRLRRCSSTTSAFIRVRRSSRLRIWSHSATPFSAASSLKQSNSLRRRISSTSAVAELMAYSCYDLRPLVHLRPGGLYLLVFVRRHMPPIRQRSICQGVRAIPVRGSYTPQAALRSPPPSALDPRLRRCGTRTAPDGRSPRRTRAQHSAWRLSFHVSRRSSVSEKVPFSLRDSSS